MLRALLVAGLRRVGRDLVGERVLAVAVEVEAALGVEHRVDVRGAGDVEPGALERVDVGRATGWWSGTQSICQVISTWRPLVAVRLWIM